MFYNGKGETIAINTGSSGDSVLTLKNTIDCLNTYTTKKISELATSTEKGKNALGNASTNYTRYKLENLKKGTRLQIIVNYNADNTPFFYDGTNNLTSSSKLSNNSNYTVYYRYLTLDKDYDVFYVCTFTSKTEANPNYCIITYIPTQYQNYPYYKNSFVPTLGNKVNDLETLSNYELSKDLGYDITGQKAKEKLQGGVWIGFGDSYTVYADSYFKSLATKYGLIYDGQGKVSSTICGDAGGNKGFAPFWQRMNTFISNYTGNGQTVDGNTYTANDVKLITFMGGANDGFGKDTWLGSPTSKDTNYIYGSLNYMFSKLAENFPNAEIIVILQPANYNYKVSSITNDEGAKTVGFASLAELQALTDYEYSQHAMVRKEKCVKEITEKFGFHIVDCIFNWYNVVNPTHRKLYWNTDKIHLTALGSSELAKDVDKKIIKVFGKM